MAVSQKKQKVWFAEYKSTLACAHCGETHPATLDFHHKDESAKIAGVNWLVKHGYSRKIILEEIDKCIVLCANCHRKLHWEQARDESVPERPVHPHVLRGKLLEPEPQLFADDECPGDAASLAHERKMAKELCLREMRRGYKWNRSH